MPGTISYSIPASRSASASSPPRPNTNGSPPFSRTTRLPGAPVLHQQPVDLVLRHLRPAALLADVDQLGLGARVPERARRDQAVVEDDVGGAEQLDRADGEEAGVAGAGADEEDGHAIASACASSSPAPAASIRRASSAPSSPCELVGHPRRAVGQPDEPANRAVLRVDSHGCVTTGFQNAHGGPLGGQGGEGVRVMHARDRRPHTLVVRARLERQRPLPGRGDEVERLRRPLQPQALQPGGGEDDRVDLARVELAQPRVDVAAQLRRPRGRAARRATAPAAARRTCPPARRGQPDKAAAREACPSARTRGRRAPRPAAGSPRFRSPAPARPARPSPSAPRGRSRPPPAPPRWCRPSATCRRRRAPGRRRW